MRAVIQRVLNASVAVDGEIKGEIKKGMLVLLGVGKDDNEDDLKYIADKTINLRIFSDEDDKMNLSIKDVGGSILAISQFTLYGDCRKGRRPNFTSSMEPVQAEKMYNDFIAYLKNEGINTQCGQFGADMKVSLVNDGPVTVILDSSRII